MKMIYRCDEAGKYDIDKISIDFPGIKIQLDKELRLYAPLVADLMAGTKPVTLRYKPDTIRAPESSILDLIQTYPGKNDADKVGRVFIPAIIVAPAKEIPGSLIIADGFKNLDHMISGMNDIYFPIYNRRIDKDTILSCFKIEFRELE